MTTKELTPAELADILESGKYEKGEGTLARRDRASVRYCCLGVYAQECGILRCAVGVRRGILQQHRFYVAYSFEGGDGALLNAISTTDLGPVLAPEWMQEDITKDGREVTVQELLAITNDETEDWTEVIRILRNLNTQES